MAKEIFNQHHDLVQINDFNEKNSVILNAHQLNQYYDTLLGNPFERLKYYNPLTREYQFYRTPGILRYIVGYYLHQGCLSTNVNYPPEILFEELKFFRFNHQVIFDIVSNVITRTVYLPTGELREVNDKGR